MNVFWVLRRVQRSPAPAMIGEDPKRDYYAAYFCTLGEDSERYMFKALNGAAVQCLAWDGSRFAIEKEIDVERINSETLHIFHWYKKVHLRTFGICPFTINELTHKAFWLNLWDTLAQKHYNRTFRLRQERQEILREILKRSIKSSRIANRIDPFSEKKSCLGWFFDIHGERAAQHPNYEEHALNFRAILESLIASNDLIEADNRISASPHSLVSLANFELEERRHQDQLSTNRRIALLTAALVLIAATQTAVEFFSAR